MKWSTGCLLVLILSASTAGWALDAAGKRYVEQMANGGPSSIRSAAQSIYHTGLRDQEVLDAAAETLAQNYQKQTSSRTQTDAMAWLCKALGQSGNGRYKPLIKQVVDTTDARNIGKHCDAAHDDLPDGGAPYKVGSFDLSKYREGGGKAGAAVKPDTALLSREAKKARAEGEHPFTLVREGMSMQEVEDLVGSPTNTTGHITGKSFNPFYYGGDTARMVALYKGLGRIVYSRKGRYSSVWRVMEIQQDAGETGYP